MWPLPVPEHSVFSELLQGREAEGREGGKEREREGDVCAQEIKINVHSTTVHTCNPERLCI